LHRGCVILLENKRRGLYVSLRDAAAHHQAQQHLPTLLISSLYKYSRLQSEQYGYTCTPSDFATKAVTLDQTETLMC